MNRFVFSLASVLEVRRNERDLLVRRLVELQDADERLLDTKGALVARRTALAEELRRLPATGMGLDVEGALNRHAYGQRLAEDVASIDAERLELVARMESARADLLQADQRVEGLERLEARQRVAQNARFERQESLELEETWQARQATRRVPS